MKRRLFISTLLLIGSALTAFGQRTPNTQNTADQTLRANGRVNPSTLGMEVQIPLGGYQGRGVSTPINLSYSSKLWRLDAYGGYWVTAPGYFRSYNRVQFAEESASGWTVSTAAPFIEYTGEGDFYDYAGDHICVPCEQFNPPVNNIASYIRRLIFHSSDGGSHELRADDAPHAIDRANIVYDWNGTFYGVDGSKLRYVETASSFILWMPDGSTYTFGARETRTGGRDPIRHTTSYTDNNGNTINYNQPAAGLPNGSVTDTLGRSIANVLPTEKPTAPVTQNFTLPGMSQPYKFYWKKLKDTTAVESALTNFTQTINYAGALVCSGPNSPSVSPFLFGITSEAWTCAESTQDYFNPVLLTKIELPNGQAYQFSYNIYGEIDRIFYPTGGEEHFVYEKVAALNNTQSLYDTVNRGVTKRQVFETAAGTPIETTYAVTTGVYPEPTGPYAVTVTNPDGTKDQRFLKRTYSTDETGNYGYYTTLNGMAYEERKLNTLGQVIGRKVTNWQETSLLIQPNSTHLSYRYPRVASEVNFTYEPGAASGLTSSVTYDYDGDTNAFDCPINVKRVSKRGFEVVSATPPAVVENQQILPSNATPIKIAETDYLNTSPTIAQGVKDTYAARNILSLPIANRIMDGANPPVAKTETLYDDTNYSPAVGRANPTTSRVWNNTDNSWIVTRANYDTYGNLTEATDAKGNKVTTTFDPTYQAFPITLTSPVPDQSGGVNGSTTSFTSSTAFDTITGLATSSTDANGQTTTISYADPVTGIADPLLRVRKVTAPNGQQTITEYGTGTNASTRWVKVKAQIDDTNWKQAISWFDGLGRTYKSQSIDTNGDVFALTCFDAAGRPSKTSNPFRNVASPTCATTTGLDWTTSTYDTDSRPWKVTTPDGAFVETNYSLATTGANIGTVVTVTDQALKQRRSVTNALGQLKRVDESTDTGGLGAIDIPNQPTNYSYDTLNNLTTVLQASSTTSLCGGASTCSQTRTFVYDSLSRLKSATNPESGTINYSYDPNGNLATKTDARTITEMVLI